MDNKNNYQWLKGEIPKWISQELVSDENAQKILQQYPIESAQSDSSTKTNLSTIILSTLGSLLIGGGIILLFAHNWEDLGKSSRTVFSFLPLILAQALCFFSLNNKPHSVALRESAGMLLFLAIAASISLIGQTYHIYGDLERFIITWLCLGIPVAYLMRSNGVLVLCTMLIVWLCTFRSWPYWLALLSLLPLWHSDYKNKPTGAFYWSVWLGAIGAALSLMISIVYSRSAIVLYAGPMLMVIASFYYITGKKIFGFDNNKFWQNPLSSLGGLGIAFYALFLTWSEAWFFKSWQDSYWNWQSYLHLTVYVACLIYVTYHLIACRDQLPLAKRLLLGLGLVGFIPLFYFLEIKSLPVILSSCMNFYILFVSVTLIFNGIKSNSLRTLNAGLLWFSLLVLFRFFDSDLSFILKGIISILIGSSFVAFNLWFSKQKRNLEVQS